MNDSMSQVFSALADPTRRAMLAQLSLADASVSELAAPYKMSLAAAAKHITVLEASGLLQKQREGRTVRCSLSAGPLQDALNWIANYRRFWTDQLDALDDYLDDRTKENER